MPESALTLDDVLSLLTEHEEDAGRTLSMVPSENATSGLAKLPLLLDAYHRYFFNETGDDTRWHFRGAERLRRLETSLTVPLLEELGRARYASAKPLSGLNAMTLALGTLGGEPGSTVVTVAPENGGHYATPSVAQRLGLRVEYLRGPDPHSLDLDHAAQLLHRVRPALVYIDQSHCLFPIDVNSLVSTVRAASPGTLVHVDASHWFGLILAGVYPNPLDEGADSFGGSTHKTFPGPQKAVLLTRDPDVEKRIRDTQDYLISSHHFAATISLGIALLEFETSAASSTPKPWWQTPRSSAGYSPNAASRSWPPTAATRPAISSGSTPQPTGSPEDCQHTSCRSRDQGQLPGRPPRLHRPGHPHRPQRAHLPGPHRKRPRRTRRRVRDRGTRHRFVQGLG